MLDWLLGRFSTVHVTAPVAGRTPSGRWRVSWQADGDDIWFESDHELAPSAEAAVCALLLPSMKRGGGLAIDAALDPVSFESLPAIRGIAREWWGMSGGRVSHRGLRVAPAGSGTGAFFTGGVDSFYTLKTASPELSHLIYVEGFDVDLSDRSRLETVTGLVRRVAAASGLPAIIVSTNLRQVRAFSRVPWDRISHGGALAAVGHLLRLHHNRILIPSGGQFDRWASVPMLDPTRSSSSLTVVNHGNPASRQDKVRALVGWPLVHENLRVCWLNRVPDLNCGVCEKCLRTRVAFLAAGYEGGLPTMPPTPLSEGIDAIAAVHWPAHTMWEDFLPHLTDASVASAVERLVARSRLRRPEGRLGRIVRKVRRAAARLTHRA